MGGVGGELLFVLKRPLEPGEHPVELGGEGVDLIPPLPQPDPAGEVVALADLPGGVGDLPHRAQGAPGQQISPRRREQHEEGKDDQRELDHPADGAVHRLGLADPPHPAVAVAGDLELHVVDKPVGVPRREGADLAVGKRGAVVKAAGHHPVERHPGRIVDREVDPVPEGLEVSVDLEGPVLRFDLPLAVLHQTRQQLPPGGEARLGAAVEQQREGEDAQQHHQQGEPEGHPQLDRQSFHSSSLST